MIKVRVPLRIWQEIIFLAKICASKEVSAIGEIRIVSPTVLEVQEHYLPRQRVSGSHAKWEKTAQAEVITEVIKSGGDVADLKFRWHSHGIMAPFMSEADMHDVKTYDGDWVVNLVVNSLGEYHLQLDILRPIQALRIPVQLEIIYPELDDDHKSELRSIREERVKFVLTTEIFRTKQTYSTQENSTFLSRLSEQEE